MVSYKILKKSKNVEEIKFEKTGLTAEFTLGDLAATVKGWIKNDKEFRDNLAISEAMVMNIEKNHPKLMKLSPEELYAAGVLGERRKLINDLSENLKILKKNIVNYETEIPNIKKTFGIEDELEVEKEIEKFKNQKVVSEIELKKAKKNFK